MRRAGTGVVIWVTAIAVGLGLGALPGAHAAVPSSAVVAAQAAVDASAPATVDRKKKKAKRDHYNPNPGLRFNEPYSRGGNKATNIRRHILRSIDSTRKGDVIQMAAWNVRGRSWSNALIRAHKRGVAVQIIMDKVNWSREHPNPEAAAVAKVLKGKEKARAVQSWLRLCAGSCRGARGIPHSKFYLFSRVQDRKYVTMFGSNNATDVAAKDQWNDLYTWVNNKTIYDTFQRVFNEMRLDKNQGSKGYVAAQFSPTQSVFFYPYKGAVPNQVGDPDMARLNKIKCTGATGGAGYNGRTKIRIMQTAIHGDRGIRLAQKLVQLKKAGCDIRIVYALMGNNVHDLLSKNKVQKLQLAYDRDRNGVYDIYLHLKSLAISGNYDGNTAARVVYNGSANWSSVPLASDDVVGEFKDVAMTKAYIDWTDFLYKHRPGSWGPVNLAPITSSVVEGRIAPVDPYALMKENGL
ncbi:phospholipase D-like domain-containing protein [Pimelobacter simplex]|uniref:phospholipase D-like domain-containing protein n=1 Tax=Nocardioides simplex TaxID=2045 RepID=UPI00214FC318|nr:phospholipase D-like domain-containing protein [Pimelobacter simplex]UUW87070.1 phospholipase D-like domain-containing protein [Pimelobacter simplex]UUW96576.1 phospholipase D-like domain-containing protein [Pimelobacter simplex]